MGRRSAARVHLNGGNELRPLFLADDYRSGAVKTRIAEKQYDSQGRWTAQITPEGRINYAYDDLGRKTSMSVGDPLNPTRVTAYDYDELGRLSAVTERTFRNESQQELTHRYLYDLLGNLDGELAANDVFTDYIYDQMNRLDKMIHYRTDGTEADLADLTDNVAVAEFDYTVRADGRRVALNEKFLRDENGDGIEEVHESLRTYDYDHLGRLTEDMGRKPSRSSSRHREWDKSPHTSVGIWHLRRCDERNVSMTLRHLR